ncbi:MAG: hypothetical protein Q7J35_09720 [Candidatus Methanoperedens sp.]|nr:hypothetical protein [Candidatus Methanoperedens sp.]
MEIHKDKQKENFTLVLTRDELIEIRDALGGRCLYLESLLRKKVAIARSKDLPEEQQIKNDKPRNMYLQIARELE